LRIQGTNLILPEHHDDDDDVSVIVGFLTIVSQGDKHALNSRALDKL
jgi:hypothetical protein